MVGGFLIEHNAKHMPRLPKCARIDDLLLFVQIALPLRSSARMDIFERN